MLNIKKGFDYVQNFENYTFIFEQAVDYAKGLQPHMVFSIVNIELQTQFIWSVPPFPLCIFIWSGKHSLTVRAMQVSGIHGLTQWVSISMLSRHFHCKLSAVAQVTYENGT